jgi:hypothetical protein
MVNLFVVIFMTYASYSLWTCTICGLGIYIPVFFCDAHIIVLKSEDIAYEVLAWIPFFFDMERAIPLKNRRLSKSAGRLDPYKFWQCLQPTRLESLLIDLYYIGLS